MQNMHRFKVKEWEKIFHKDSNKKKVGVATLKSKKIDFKLKIIMI